MKRGFWTVRRQLLALFGVIILAAGCVLALDAYYQQTHEATLTQVLGHAVGGQAAVKVLTQAYGITIVGTTFQVRNQRMTWRGAMRTIDRARQRIDQAFATLKAAPMPPRQRAVLANMERARKRADAAVAALYAQLQTHDMAGVERIADTRLYGALEPMLLYTHQLADLRMLDTRQRLYRSRQQMRNLNYWRIGLSLVALLIVLIVGSRVLGNVYHGIEQLVRLSHGMRQGDYDTPLEGRPISGESGEVVDAFLAMRQQVKRKDAAVRRSEARAREASRAKSAFLAAMSHEIRTPMIGITGMLELLEHTPLDAEQRRSITVVQNSAESLLQIIGDILDFSKIEAGRMELAPRDIDLVRLVDRTTQNFLGIASSKGLTLELVADDDLARAYVGDPLRLRQILSNFLSNALKFTSNGGIAVRVQNLGTIKAGHQRIAIRVRDTGIGISEQQRKSLFQPFAQADSGTARQFGGTGLGLAICRQLATLMDGTIELDSTPGKGSTFSLIVPLPLGDLAHVEADAVAAAEDFPTRPLPTIAQAQSEHSLILVADDHATNREVLTRQLARAGFACETAADGREAFQRWESGNYALVLTDIHMPHMDGYQLAGAIRKAEQTGNKAHTPIVAITANVSKGEREHCLEIGMDDFLGKPFRIAQLSATLRRWLPHITFTTAAAMHDDEDFLLTTSIAPQDAPATATPIDLDILREITGDDDILARNMLGDFLASANQDLMALRERLDADDLRRATSEAHRMKGAAALIGANHLRDAAARIEDHGHNDDLDAMRAGVEPLVAELDVLTAWVEARNA